MDLKKNNNFQKVFHLLRPHKRNLFLGSLCIIIYVACWPLLAWLAGQLIPAIGNGDLSTVIKTIIKALVIFLIQKTAQLGQDILVAKPALCISQDLRQNLFTELQKIKLGSLDKLSSGDITYRLTEDADRVGEIIYKSIQDTTPCILQLIAVFGYMIYLDIKLSIATFLLAPIVILLVSKFGEKVMLAAESSQKQVSDLAGLLNESILGLPLVRAFAAEDWLEKRFEDEVIRHRDARYKTLKLLAFQHPVVGFIEATGILAVLAIGAARIQNGGLDSSGFSSYVAALLMLIDPISHLTTNFNEIKQGQASLRRLNEITKEDKEREDIVSSITIEKPEGEITLTNINFAYEDNKEVLSSLNLLLKAGSVTALVGRSGAGKSTIFSLLLRFIEPKSGKIEFDKVNINNIKSKNLRQNIALVPQHSTVFSGSIKEAILFGREATNDQLIKASKIANSHDFIMELPYGYNTFIEERGSNLSGGQLQRISIARAILGNPSVLLLDEATSALDAEAEESVQKGLNQAMKGRTVVVIAHRLVTVQEADRIYVLEKGKVNDFGTHDELIKKGGKYKELCEKQFIRQVPH